MIRTCQFPECTESIEHRAKNARYCIVHSKRIHNKRIGRSVSRRYNGARREHPPHDPNFVSHKVCKICCDMPWVRTADRMCEASGGGLYPVTVNGLCRGCGKGWAPEPPLELGSALRSSSSMVVDHGRLYGSEILYRTGTGSRKI